MRIAGEPRHASMTELDDDRNTPGVSDEVRGDRFGVSMSEIVWKIRSLVEFREEVFAHSANYTETERFIAERPEILVNSIVDHIKYLFAVPRLEGLIPRLNEIYLFTQEMGNFMQVCRTMLGMQHLPDASVISEIYRRINRGDDAGK
jgi:hypothetical protein